MIQLVVVHNIHKNIGRVQEGETRILMFGPLREQLDHVFKQVTDIALANGNRPWEWDLCPLCPSCYCNHAGQMEALMDSINLMSYLVLLLFLVVSKLTAPVM